MDIISQREYESKYLENEHPILIKPVIAAALNSDRQAYFLQQVKYWMNKNRDKGRGYHNGQQWMYNTLDDWQAEFPWLSVMTIRRIVESLKNSGILITGNYNKKKYDKTTWYSINEYKLDEIIDKHKSQCSKRTKATVQNEQMDLTNLDIPIPETCQSTKEREPAQKTPARSNSSVKEIIAHLNDLYHNRYGYNYPVVKGQDHGIIKNMLAEHGPELTRAIMARHIDNNDQWIQERGHALTTIKKSLPEYLAAINKAAADENAESTRVEYERQRQEKMASEEAEQARQRAEEAAKPEPVKINEKLQTIAEFRKLWEAEAARGSEAAANKLKQYDLQEAELHKRLSELEAVAV